MTIASYDNRFLSQHTLTSRELGRSPREEITAFALDNFGAGSYVRRRYHGAMIRRRAKARSVSSAVTRRPWASRGGAALYLGLLTLLHTWVARAESTPANST